MKKIIKEKDINENNKKEKSLDRKYLAWSYKLWIIMMMVSLCIFLFSTYQLIILFLDYRAGEKEYKALQQYAEVETKDATEGVTEIKKDNIQKIENKDSNEENPENTVVDFGHLEAINKDIVGWIYFPNIGINYPVVQTTDNEYYLTHTYMKNENRAGSIFMEYTNAYDFSDLNTFLFGHNMKNGTMFGLLNRYQKEEYYKKNPYFWIYTPRGKYKYQIFSCYVTSTTGKSYMNKYSSAEEYRTYLDRISKLSIYNTGVNVTAGDKIISLSTCTSISEESRCLVHGKLIESIKNN